MKPVQMFFEDSVALDEIKSDFQRVKEVFFPFFLFLVNSVVALCCVKRANLRLI